MNFDPDLVDSIVVSLTWGNIQEDWEPGQCSRPVVLIRLIDLSPLFSSPAEGQ